MKNMIIPADVPQNAIQTFMQNYKTITKETDRLILFTADHKIEHLNKDFYGKNIPPEANNPEYLFTLASKSHIGAFATQLGLIARYGKKYPDIAYIAKLNSKTNIIPTKKKDPFSAQLWDVQNVIDLQKNTNLNICGIGYTVYIASEYESCMLHHAAQTIYEAHKHGLITIIWMYPRGKYITHEKDADLIAGAAGIANCLNADFVKIQVPAGNVKLLQQAVNAAGNTKVLCSGGEKKDTKIFLKELHDQIHIGGTHGNAIGRNIFQRPFDEALALTKAISAIVYEDKNRDEAPK